MSHSLCHKSPKPFSDLLFGFPFSLSLSLARSLALSLSLHLSQNLEYCSSPLSYLIFFLFLCLSIFACLSSSFSFSPSIYLPLSLFFSFTESYKLVCLLLFVLLFSRKPLHILFFLVFFRQNVPCSHFSFILWTRPSFYASLSRIFKIVRFSLYPHKSDWDTNLHSHLPQVLDTCIYSLLHWYLR